MLKSTIIEFNKRFAQGEQDIYIHEDKILKEPKMYFWEQCGVYNHIQTMIERIKSQIGQQTEEFWFGEFGIVSRLAPIQRAYNAIKNRKHEYLSRIALGVLVVEDGSVDLDNLEEEGVGPGKVIVYRQGSKIPTMLNQPMLAKEFENEEERLLMEFERQYEAIILQEEDGATVKT